MAIDKHTANLRVLRQLHPDITVIEADMAEPGPWTDALAGADRLWLGTPRSAVSMKLTFARNNVTATQRMLERATVAVATSFISARRW